MNVQHKCMMYIFSGTYSLSAALLSIRAKHSVITDNYILQDYLLSNLLIAKLCTLINVDPVE